MSKGLPPTRSSVVVPAGRPADAEGHSRQPTTLADLRFAPVARDVKLNGGLVLTSPYQPVRDEWTPAEAPPVATLLALARLMARQAAFERLAVSDHTIRDMHVGGQDVQDDR